MVERRAVVLLSGGLDSTTSAAIARSQGFKLYALTFDYGQRHRIEIEKAADVAKHLGVTRHIVVPVDLRRFGGSALTSEIDVPKARVARGDRPRDSRHLRAGAQHDLPVVRARLGRGARSAAISSSA